MLSFYYQRICSFLTGLRHLETSKISVCIKFCPLCDNQVIAIQKNSQYFSLPSQKLIVSFTTLDWLTSYSWLISKRFTCVSSLKITIFKTFLPQLNWTRSMASSNFGCPRKCLSNYFQITGLKRSSTCCAENWENTELESPWSY